MFLDIFKKNREKDIMKIAEKELQENKSVIQSLKDYDEGKKEISTDKIRGHLRNIQSSL